MFKIDNYSFLSTKLISLDVHLNEMINLYDSGNFPKVLLLNGQKGLGKFTLAFHFLNYIYSKKEKFPYNVQEKIINIKSFFYKSILNLSCSDVLFLQAEEGKNIKIDNIRDLKNILSKSSLSSSPRFVIIDEVEFLNKSSVNALLKTLEEPSNDNYFILINNQQLDLVETISSRCLKTNIYLDLQQQKKVIDYFIENKKTILAMDYYKNLTPGLLLQYSELSNRYKITNEDTISSKLYNLLHGYKKDKNKALINMSIFLIDQFFYDLIQKNKNKIEFLSHLRLTIINKINNSVLYNLNISSVLNLIEIKLKDVR
tara:strand:- start:970 stop:1911 length:942 start_codon:yes stop_codon:yes gene_type:complete